jgi:hypothetical protein
MHRTDIILDEESEKYLAACARIRKTSKRYLIHKLLEVICNDQLVTSILDDESKIVPREEWHRFCAKLAATDINEGQEVT